MKTKIYPWLINFYKDIILSKIFNKFNFGLIITYSCDLGVDLLIFNIIKWMYCDKKIKYKFCNLCLNCNLLNNNNHPNYFIFNDKNKITLNNVKYINKLFFENLYISKYKVIYFSNFNFDNKFINNFLLKIIEESFYNVIIIFTCLNFINIPLTILSRCYKYILYNPSEKYILNYLLSKKYFKYNFSKKEILSSIRLSNFSPILSIFLLKKLWLFRKKFFNNINYILHINIDKYFNLFNYNNSLLCNNLYWFLYLLLDILKYKKFSIKYIYNIDYLNKIKYLSKFFISKKIFLIINEILFFFNDIKKNFNINKNILIYKLIYNIYNIFNFK